MALAVSGNSVYVAGTFESRTVDFGTVTLTNASQNPNFSQGSTDMFVAKLTDAGSTGSFVWAQRAGGTRPGFTTYDLVYALAVSGASVYIAGAFESPTADFGPITLTNAGLDSDVFVAKLTDAGPTGSFEWAQQAGGTHTDVAKAMVVSGTNVYVAGFFNSPMLEFGATILTNAGIFVAKLTDVGPTGSFVWAQQAGGTRDDYAQALAVNGTSVYVAGTFSSPTMDFGPVTLTNVSTSPDPYDVFVAKLTDAGPTCGFV